MTSDASTDAASNSTRSVNAATIEMRHPKKRDDLMVIAKAFEPYLTARASNTIASRAP